MIVIDSREPNEIKEWIEEEGGEYREEALSCGDFIVRDSLIERKRYGDLIGRINQSERDLWQQLLAVESAADKNDYRPVLLTEGEWSEPLQWSNMTPRAPTMAMASLFKMGISIVHVTGPRACAQWLVKMDDDSTHDVGSIRDTPSVPPELYPRYLTEGFPGVGPARAEDILERYGTFATVVQTLVDDPDDLKEISGIGDATVEKMTKYVTAELPDE